jgi:hypothetical protein
VRYDADDQAVVDRCQQILDERNIKNATIEISPTAIGDVERGNPIAVRIVAPASDNTIMHLQFFNGNLEAQAIMVKE